MERDEGHDLAVVDPTVADSLTGHVLELGKVTDAVRAVMQGGERVHGHAPSDCPGENGVRDGGCAMSQVNEHRIGLRLSERQGPQRTDQKVFSKQW